MSQLYIYIELTQLKEDFWCNFRIMWDVARTIHNVHLLWIIPLWLFPFILDVGFIKQILLYRLLSLLVIVPLFVLYFIVFSTLVLYHIYYPKEVICSRPLAHLFNPTAKNLPYSLLKRTFILFLVYFSFFIFTRINAY